MNPFLRVVAQILVIACFASCSGEPRLRNARIYGVPFESLYIVAQDSNAIRKYPDYKAIINEQKSLSKIVRFVEIPCSKAVIQDKVDVRVVIDVEYFDGSTKSRAFSMGRFKDANASHACVFSKGDEDALTAVIQDVSKD